MRWTLSRFQTGAMVEVRSKEEILATLDEYGCIDGLPFMPEMLAFCGKTFLVRAVAHKTCDTARQTWQGRRLQKAVHLAGLHCDGSAHGGCQAGCSLFWKDEWLKMAGGDMKPPRSASEHSTQTVCSVGQLFANTRSHQTDEGEEIR